MPTCSTCRFWVHYDDATGHCHAHPPVVFVLPGQIVSGWPEVEADDFCGEHQSAPIVQVKEHGSKTEDECKRLQDRVANLEEVLEFAREAYRDALAKEGYAWEGDVCDQLDAALGTFKEQSP